MTSLLIPNTDVQLNGVSRDGGVVVGRVNDYAFRYARGQLGLLGASDRSNPPVYLWDVSADGRVATGFWGWANSTRYIFLWREGFAPLDAFNPRSEGEGRALSSDGRTVAGWIRPSSSFSCAVRWSEQGIEYLPLPGARESRALGASSNGSIVVGEVEIPQRGRFAFRWRGNAVELLPDFGFGSRAFGVNADGRVVVGDASDGATSYAVRWVDGSLDRLLEAPGQARRCSGDGQVVIGEYLDANNNRRAFRWHNGVWQDLGALGGKVSYAYDLTADGRTVVGTASEASLFSPWRAWRWRNGVQEDLNRVYADLLTPYSRLLYAMGISPDGRYIVGLGWNSSTETYAGFLLDTWRTGDVNGDGCVNDADLLAVLAAFGTKGSSDARHEDIDKDGIVSDADLLTVLFEFGSGC